ncbi:hypothetical protein [Clostridium sp. DJ247]|nr:hypothetical protein [Clostridium sp. DJ247]MBC2581993.1 hypothetical protein [Clostridium sp. DJ247]
MERTEMVEENREQFNGKVLLNYGKCIESKTSMIDPPRPPPWLFNKLLTI